MKGLFVWRWRLEILSKDAVDSPGWGCVSVKQPVAATVATPEPTRAVEDNEDGPAYDPSGGQGSLAKGTTNTYVIDRMDEMSPEEYQKALQETISKRQEERRKQLMKTGGYGNRASWDYLNNLTGESGQLRSDSAFDD